MQWNQHDVEHEQDIYVAGNPGQGPDEQAPDGGPVQEPHPLNHPPPVPVDPRGDAAGLPPVDDNERRARAGEAAYLRLHANDPVVEGGMSSIMQVIMCMLTIMSEKIVPHVVFDMFMSAVEAALPEGDKWPKYAPAQRIQKSSNHLFCDCALRMFCLQELLCVRKGMWSEESKRI
jgi:hypothetical protein